MIGAAEHGNKNRQILSCLSPGSVEIKLGPGSGLVCSDFPLLIAAVVSVGGCG